METLNAAEDAYEFFSRGMNVANECLAICPFCGETVDLRNRNPHSCKKNRKNITMIQNGVFLRKRTTAVFQRH